MNKNQQFYEQSQKINFFQPFRKIIDFSSFFPYFSRKINKNSKITFQKKPPFFLEIAPRTPGGGETGSLRQFVAFLFKK